VLLLGLVHLRNEVRADEAHVPGLFHESLEVERHLVVRGRWDATAFYGLVYRLDGRAREGGEELRGSDVRGWRRATRVGGKRRHHG
jgi:hypothetical protein